MICSIRMVKSLFTVFMFLQYADMQSWAHCMELKPFYILSAHFIASWHVIGLHYVLIHCILHYRPLRSIAIVFPCVWICLDFCQICHVEFLGKPFALFALLYCASLPCFTTNILQI